MEDAVDDLLKSYDEDEDEDDAVDDLSLLLALPLLLLALLLLSSLLSSSSLSSSLSLSSLSDDDESADDGRVGKVRRVRRFKGSRMKATGRRLSGVARPIIIMFQTETAGIMLVSRNGSYLVGTPR